MNLKVWIATYEFPYEGKEVLGLYATEDLAKAACQENHHLHHSDDLEWFIVDGWLSSTQDYDSDEETYEIIEDIVESPLEYFAVSKHFVDVLTDGLIEEAKGALHENPLQQWAETVIKKLPHLRLANGWLPIDDIHLAAIFAQIVLQIADRINERLEKKLDAMDE